MPLRAPEAAPRESRLLGQAPAFLEALDAVSAAAPLAKPVLLVGERGTGKEGFAERLHFLSSRWDGPFEKLNCAAISETLLESELFGHEAGAFTGASKAHTGRFERAHGGTLFLDELATTSPLVQEKILRVIEYGEFERLGGSRTLKTDIRLVAATNEDLPTLAAQGRFREDLLDRLAFDVITLPPLRAREEDIPLLAEAFATRMSAELGWEVFPGFSAAAHGALLRHPWPGNIRELKNVVERSVYRHGDQDGPVNVIVLDPFASPWRPSARPKAADTEAPGGISVPTYPMDFTEAVRRYEIALLEGGLEASQFNQKRCAELLSMTYHQLRGLLRKYDLNTR